MGIKPVVEDLSTADEIRYRVHAECFVQATGNLLGVGVGEASTNEEKYKWRSAVCQEEFDATPEDRRRTKYARARSGGNGPAFYTANQIRTQPADLANTVLKMASKRAMMAVTLTVTAASDVFTQDIEDLPEEIRHDMAAGETSTEPAKPKPAADPPKQTAPTTASDGVKSVTGKVTSISPKQGSSNGRPWIKWAVKLESGASYTVFNKQEMADTAIAARDEKFAVVIHYKESAYGNDVVTIEPASARQPGGEG
jgi:hypothetical protein